MVTISDNDLRQLMLYVQATAGKVQDSKGDLRLSNRIRLAKNTTQKLMRREDVRRIMSDRKGNVVAEK